MITKKALKRYIDRAVAKKLDAIDMQDVKRVLELTGVTRLSEELFNNRDDRYMPIQLVKSLMKHIMIGDLRSAYKEANDLDVEIAGAMYEANRDRIIIPKGIHKALRAVERLPKALKLANRMFKNKLQMKQEWKDPW